MVRRGIFNPPTKQTRCIFMLSKKEGLKQLISDRIKTKAIHMMWFTKTKLLCFKTITLFCLNKKQEFVY